MEQKKKEQKRAKIIVDSRELNGGVPKAIDQFCTDVDFEVKTLDTGDYILSDRTAVERKKTDDFWHSIFETKELFSQLSDLKKSYEKTIVIIEGDGLYSRNVNPNVIRGIISAITVDMYIPIIYTANQLDTAQYLARIAKREQIEEKRPLSIHGKRSHLTDDEMRVYITSSICEIGPINAKKLLTELGSVRNVFKASKDELQIVKGIGPITAEKIDLILGGSYGKK